MAIFAPQIIHYLYSDKWAPAIPIFQIFALGFAVRHSTGSNWNVLAISQGKTKYILYSNLLVTFGIVTVGYWLIRSYGMVGGAIYNLFATFFIVSIIRIFMITRLIGNFNYLKCLYPPIVSGIISGFIIYNIMIIFDIHNLIYCIFALISFLSIYLIFLINMNKELLSEIRELYNVVQS